MGHGVFAAQHDRQQVDLELTLPGGDRILFDEGQAVADAGVVDQDGQAAHRRDGAVDDRDPLVFFRDVMLEGEGRAGDLGVDRVGQCLNALQIDVGDGDLRALARQHPGHGFAQPAGRAGDEGLFARDPSCLACHHFAPSPAAAVSMNRAMSISLCVTPSASWVVSRTSTRL